MINQELKQARFIQTEEEYHYYYKLFIKDINKMIFNVKSFYGNPSNYIQEFEDLLNEGIRIGLISQEYKEEKMIKLYQELNSPNEFKYWLSKQSSKLRKKFRLKK